jgi:predicted O-methyltransferase YrrM
MEEPAQENQALERELEIASALGEFPLGHYNSPFPSSADVDRAALRMGSPPPQLAGVDLGPRRQVELLERLAVFARDADLPREPADDWRFFHNNFFFGYGDADCLLGMIRHLEPRRIVEVGSGFSSALILDTNQRYFDGAIDCVFVEPEPKRLLQLLRPGDMDKITFIPEPVQDVSLTEFEKLEANDVLFIDSSHVAKAGSDVNHAVFEILPLLKPGVHIHFHDIFYPFEYARDWIAQGRAWSESYLVRAFLQFNASFEICLFCDYLRLFHADTVRRTVPTLHYSVPGSLWLRRTR